MYPDLVRFIHRKVWDAERARELAQEVFVRALRDQPDRPRPWLFTVAANLARDEARGAIRRRAHLTLLKSEAEDRQAGQESVAEALERRELLGDVRNALEDLSDRDREILLLWSGGLSYGEIAEATGLSAGAIGTTLSRARKRLVAAYEEREKGHAARQ
jgi:RNA polymerase sigma-70 factor (ECF subfamily)